MREAVIVPTSYTPLTMAHRREFNSICGAPEHRAHSMAYRSMASIFGNVKKHSLRN